MSTVLAIDTCDRAAGVAVGVDGEILAHFVETCPTRHSVRLLDLVGWALDGAGVERADLTLVAATCGPGSFTGVRVGIATAKALSFSLGLPVVSASSLSVVARGCLPFAGIVVPVLDARKGQVYACAVDGPSGEPLLPEAAWDPSVLASTLAELDRPVLFSGSGLEPYGTCFARVLGARFLAVPATRRGMVPADLAALAIERFQEGKTVSPADLRPVYLRLSEAEEARRRSAV